VSIRPLRHVTALAALAAAFTLGGAVTASAAQAGAARPGIERPATITGTETGYGATLSAAQFNANQQMNGDYYGCRMPYTLIADGQEADGSWWAEVQATCRGYN
jgi:hypothetical protein